MKALAYYLGQDSIYKHVIPALDISQSCTQCDEQRMLRESPEEVWWPTGAAGHVTGTKPVLLQLEIMCMDNGTHEC